MTKYIGKRVIYSILLFFALGFVLYMLTMTRPPDPLGCYLYSETGVAVLYDDDLYYYSRDPEASCFTLFYFIPVKAGIITDQFSMWFPYAEDTEGVVKNFAEKYYISPFTNRHIVKRQGLSSTVYTLYSIESIS